MFLISLFRNISNKMLFFIMKSTVQGFKSETEVYRPMVVYKMFKIIVSLQLCGFIKTLLNYFKSKTKQSMPIICLGCLRLQVCLL